MMESWLGSDGGGTGRQAGQWAHGCVWVNSSTTHPPAPPFHEQGAGQRPKWGACTLYWSPPTRGWTPGTAAWGGQRVRPKALMLVCSENRAGLAQRVGVQADNKKLNGF